MSVVYTLLAALAVGLILNKLRLPGGMMIGAAIGACALNLAVGGAQLPSYFKTIAQIAVGAFIGAGVSREELKLMRRTLKPAAVVILGLLILNILTGLIIRQVSSLDLLTALLCCAPGGVSDIPIIAAEMGADAPKVLVMQLIRFIVGIGIFPIMIGKLTQKEDQFQSLEVKTENRQNRNIRPLLFTLAVAAAFGYLGKVSGIPAGAMAVSTLGSILFKQIYPKAGVPRAIRKAAQYLSGAYVGASIGMEQVRELRLLTLPALILLFSLILGTLTIGMALKRLKCFSLREGMLAATPAGASDMALISADLGIYNIKLILIHIMRVITVITFFPSLLKLISGWLG